MIKYIEILYQRSCALFFQTNKLQPHMACDQFVMIHVKVGNGIQTVKKNYAQVFH